MSSISHFEILHFQAKTTVATLWATFGNIRANVIPTSGHTRLIDCFQITVTIYALDHDDDDDVIDDVGICRSAGRPLPPPPPSSYRT